MKTLFVSRKSWHDCFNSIYSHDIDDLMERLNERYGIIKWLMTEDLRQVKLTFDDEKKMVYWILRWS